MNASAVATAVLRTARHPFANGWGTHILDVLIAARTRVMFSLSTFLFISNSPQAAAVTPAALLAQRGGLLCLLTEEAISGHHGVTNFSRIWGVGIHLNFDVV